MSVTCALVLESTAEFFSIGAGELKSLRRTRRVAAARHTFCWMAKKMTGKSYAQIGLAVGGRDHTTVMSAVASIEARRLAQPDVAGELAMLEGIINTSAGIITALNFQMPKDVDARLVAQRLISQPLSQFTLSIEEIKAMAFFILGADFPSLTPAASVSPTEGGDLAPPHFIAPHTAPPVVILPAETALGAAALEAARAFSSLENSRFSPGEKAAQAALNTALKALRSHFDLKSKQEAKAS